MVRFTAAYLGRCTLAVMNPATARRALHAYLLVTWTVSSVFYVLIIKSVGTRAAGGAYTTALMWCPALGALLACKYLGQSVGSLGWQWGETRYQIASYLIPLGYARVTYSIAWVTGLAVVNPQQTAEAFSQYFGLGSMPRLLGIALYFMVVATIGVIQNCATTLGEEIGWRGFLVPELAKRFSFTGTALLSGVHLGLLAYSAVRFWRLQPRNASPVRACPLSPQT